MTISTTANRQNYNSPVLAVPLAFPYPLYAEADMDVLYGASLMAVLNVDYTVQLNPLSSPTPYANATITPLAGLIAKVAASVAGGGTDRITLLRTLDVTQDYDVPPSPRLDEAGLQRAFDRIVLIVQQVADLAARSVTLYSNDLDGTGKFNARGNSVDNAADGSTAQSLATVSQLAGVALGLIPNGTITNAKMANMAAGTVKANTTGGAAPPTDVVLGTLRGNMALFASKAAAVAAAVFGAGTTITWLTLAGFSAPGDKGGGLYKWVAGAPSHNAKFQSADGAWWELSDANPNPYQLGAAGDGATDDSTPWQNLINYAIATNATVKFPAATFKVGTALTINASLKIVGQGYTRSILLLGTTTMNGIVVSSASAVHFEDFCIAGSVSATAGAGIVVDTGAGSSNTASTFNRLRFTDGWTAMDFERAGYFILSNSTFLNQISRGVIVQNLFNADEGDSQITGCRFHQYVGGGTAVAIFQTSSGALKVINNTFVNWYRHYFLSLAASAQTSQLLIQNNTMELAADTSIVLFASATPIGSFEMVKIEGNVIDAIAGATNLIWIGAGASNWLNNVSIKNNTLKMFASGAGLNGMNLDRINHLDIDRNIIEQVSGTAYGIVLSANLTDVQLGRNLFWGTFADTVSNAAPAVKFEPDFQEGTVAITTSTAYGTHFTGTTAVVFPLAYDSQFPIEVTMTPIGAVGGQLSGGEDSAPTTAGFTARAFGLNSGGVTSFRWSARGRIA